MDLETLRQAVRQQSIANHKAEFENNLTKIIRWRKTRYGDMPRSFSYLNLVSLPHNVKY